MVTEHRMVDVYDVPFARTIFPSYQNNRKIIAAIAIAALFVFITYYLGPRAQPFPGGPPSLNVIVDFGIVRCAAGFLLGMLLFKIYNDSMGINFFKRSAVFITLFGGLIIAMHAEAADLLIVSFFPLIILAAAYNTTLIKRVLDISILQRLGDWSFSIYMVHVPIMYIFWIFQMKANPSMLASFPPESTGPPDYNLGFLTCLLVVALTLVTAALSYKYIEVPARNYLNRKFSPKDLNPAKA
jgi:peptidoglycan/LPS O-acetylase OafA/YrhL